MAGSVSKMRGGGKGSKSAARKTSAKRSAAKTRNTGVPRSATVKRSATTKRRGTKRAAKTQPGARRYHPGPPIADEAALAAALAELEALDPATVGAMLEIGGPPSLRWREPGFAGLVAIIVSQQVSVASANAMVARLHAAFSPLDAASVLAAEEARLKACGLSQAKMNALKALAEATTNGLDLAASPRSRPKRRMTRWSRSRGLGRGPPIFSCCSASVTPTRFPPATSRSRRRRGSRLGSANGPTRASWNRSPSAGGPCAASRRGCFGPITAA